jgi:hypothetical protein
MSSSLIRPIRFEDLNISEMLECSTLLTENVYTPAAAQAVELGKPYGVLVAAHSKYADILRRNPALVETASLTGDVLRVRHLMGALNETLRAAGIINDAGLAEAVSVVANIAAPYLKTRNSATMLAVLGDAKDMCDALQDAAVSQKTDAVGLTKQVEAIQELVRKCNRLLDIRGEEREYRKRAGSATKARTALQKQYRVIFTTIIPAIYLTTTDDAVKEKLIEMINHTNATLDTFRHLVSGGGDWVSSVGDGDTRPIDPSIPDTGPADPPGYNGGTYIDPNARKKEDEN